MIDPDTQKAVAELARQVLGILREVSELKLSIDTESPKRIQAAKEAAEKLAVEMPSDLRALRHVEVQIVGGLEELETLALPTDLALRVSKAWAHHKEDMIRRKRLATGTRSWSIEHEINAPGDESIN